ncbi:hypothetical protein CDAR_300141 [Caerostris darwini]|uniref:Uncharacterized protein n=1 Tax=Caerostris darwini TaxID=1538125 RepID=A0AAV4W392_9ARAC|nr:hypothetical protein CDAR_300141 [Caerostris darwini]
MKANQALQNLPIPGNPGRRLACEIYILTPRNLESGRYASTTYSRKYRTFFVHRLAMPKQPVTNRKTGCFSFYILEIEQNIKRSLWIEFFLLNSTARVVCTTFCGRMLFVL